MKLKDLIQDKNFDYIEFRHRLPEELGDVQIFMGACKSINGKLISLDAKNYSEDMEIKEYKYWSDNIAKKGLTVIY